MHFNMYAFFYVGWFEFIYNTMAISHINSEEFINIALERIKERLIQVEISERGMEYFLELLASN